MTNRDVLENILYEIGMRHQLTWHSVFVEELVALLDKIIDPEKLEEEYEE
jgi:hypothetical protein